MFYLELSFLILKWVEHSPITDNAYQYQCYKFLREYRYLKTDRWLMVVIGILLYYYWTILLFKRKDHNCIKVRCILRAWTVSENWCSPINHHRWTRLWYKCIIELYTIHFLPTVHHTMRIFRQHRTHEFFWRMNACIRWHFQFYRNRYLYIPKQECDSFMQTYLYIRIRIRMTKNDEVENFIEKH